jgi:TonB family protein
MTDPKPLIPSASGEHLSAETLYQYLNGHLPPEASHEAERHLLDCNLCTEALEGLATVPPENTQHALFDLNRSIKIRSLKRKQNRLLNDLKAWALVAAILFLLLFSAIIVWYQTRVHQPSPVAPQENPAVIPAPTPVIGEQAYQDYIRTHQQYPPQARRQQISGRVKLQFMVNPDSTISDIVVLEGPASGLREEAIRLLQQGPKWQPAREAGSAIRARAILEIAFQLPEKPNN